MSEKEKEWYERPYFLQIPDFNKLNDKGSFTVARVIDGIHCVELHYIDGVATIEYGTRLDDDYWESEIEEINWFDKNMSEEVMANKLWNLFDKEYGENNYEKER